MIGDLNRLDLTAKVDGISIDVRLDVESGVLFNAGTGVFPLLGMEIHQYSVPRFATTGTIAIEDDIYQVEGVSWFDRQWQHQDTSTADSIHWSWVDLNLDNGDAISLWSAPDLASGRERAWATVLHADGTQTVTAAEPLVAGARDLWTSPESGQTYPTRWTVRIPALDAEIEVVPAPREQEIVSQVPMLHKYEGASQMHGTYRGKQVTGFGYVELVGVWR
jgi:predicted secreted hydrolase